MIEADAANEMFIEFIDKDTEAWNVRITSTVQNTYSRPCVKQENAFSGLGFFTVG